MEQKSNSKPPARKTTARTTTRARKPATPAAKPATAATEKKAPADAIKMKLAEGTAAKNLDKKPSPKRLPVLVKKATIDYEMELKKLQIELLKMQNHIKDKGLKVLMIFEGRDAAGKGGTIKRITEHLNPRGARVVALEKPSDRERTQWYFQRYIQHLPTEREIVLFDRSWYNRAMVEPIMGFCSDEENKRFLKDVPLFEQMLVKNGIKMFKFYFSVSREEQAGRFEARKTNPLKQFKISPVDQQAQKLWDQYTVKKFQMLSESNRTIAPWTVIRSDNKKLARLGVIKYILSNMDYTGKIAKKDLEPDPKIVISGIDELKLMEDNLMKPGELPG